MTELVSHEVPLAAIPASDPMPRPGPARLPVEQALRGSHDDTPNARGSTRFTHQRAWPATQTAFLRFTTFGHGVLRGCEWADGWLHGRRAGLIATTAALAAFTPVLEEVADLNRRPGPDELGTIFTLLFLFTLWLSAFSLAGSLRDGNGIWRGRIFWEHLFVLGQDLLERLREFCSAPRYEKARLLFIVTFALSSGTLASANCVSLASRTLQLVGVRTTLFETVGWLQGWGVFWAFFAVLFLTMWRGNLPSTFRPADEQEALLYAALSLPPVVDLERAPPEIGGDTLLNQLLAAMASWRPRRWDNELGYQLALQRHLQKTLPTLRIERERMVGKSRSQGIADFIVDNSIVLEVKKGFRRKSTIDRAIGQMYAYGQHWPDKPAILVVFEASPTELVDSFATQRLLDLHERQASLTVRMPVPAAVSPS